jgi:divalent metal cation (Fe/Co/Zn/Cd) transporter
MATVALSTAHDRIWRLQLITLAWMTAEVVGAAVTAWRAHSVALAAFGADSVIELLSAGLVLAAQAGPARNKLGGRVGGILLLALTVVIATTSALALANGAVPRTSPFGILLLVAAAVIMPWLSREKQKLARQTGNLALAADAVQSSACAYLAWIAVAGLILNAAFGWHWADPLAALGLIPPIAIEGWRATTRGAACQCC